VDLYGWFVLLGISVAIFGLGVLLRRYFGL
jgi:hypothetical protein